jgi:hypothetical protein
MNYEMGRSNGIDGTCHCNLRKRMAVTLVLVLDMPKQAKVGTFLSTRDCLVAIHHRELHGFQSIR